MHYLLPAPRKNRHQLVTVGFLTAGLPFFGRIAPISSTSEGHITTK